MDSLAGLYIYLHRNPELSFQEKETAARIAKELRDAGYEVTTGIGGHGAVGVLKNGAGPCVMLRCDMDALPVTEATGLEYASKVRATTEKNLQTGVMHACGHDIHMTNLIGVARYLASHRDQWNGTLLVVGQPAEERIQGASAMLKDGLFERFPKPDMALALHVAGDMPTGKVAYRAGPLMANLDSVDITMKGRGGHGSSPHLTIDPVTQAAELVMSLQLIVTREISPLEPALITVGSIHGGTQYNIIGDECHLQLTVRSYSADVRKRLLDGIHRRAKSIATGAGAPEPIIRLSEQTPAVLNDADLTARLAAVSRKVIGDENVLAASQSMGGEDFSRYGEAGIPIVMYRLGSVSQRRLDQYSAGGVSPPSLHSALYYPDFEEALTTGIVTMTSSVLDLMKPASK
ncbi:M20 metallopeptidase family protein [Planctomicrobium sp. SH527]|uniref:M20 metallopeptidase family protein n=1 Tax=Planctomicrobium sp. SH527 TaxID=3448123 RepID=UPI003F5C8FA9